VENENDHCKAGEGVRLVKGWICTIACTITDTSQSSILQELVGIVLSSATILLYVRPPSQLPGTHRRDQTAPGLKGFVLILQRRPLHINKLRKPAVDR